MSAVRGRRSKNERTTPWKVARRSISENLVADDSFGLCHHQGGTEKCGEYSIAKVELQPAERDVDAVGLPKAG
jgi:hypothetical protein